jgi:hypothetical protein
MIGVWLRAVSWSRNYLRKYQMGFDHGASLDENLEYRGGRMCRERRDGHQDGRANGSNKVAAARKGPSCWAWNLKILRAALLLSAVATPRDSSVGVQKQQQ